MKKSYHSEGQRHCSARHVTLAIALLALAFALAPAQALAEGDSTAETSSPTATEQTEEDIWMAEVSGGRNATVATLEAPGAEELLASAAADSVRLRATMSYDGQITRDVTHDVSLDELANGPAELDFGDFGKFQVTVSYLLDDSVVHECEPVDVGITADSYTIAPVSATLPTTFFSLNLWGPQSVRAEGPTIIVMERPNAYSWDDLPAASDDLYGAYALPYLSTEDITYQPGDATAAALLFRERVDAMAAYVRDLVELDPTSHFDLYCVDYYAGIVQRVIYANRIPEGNYTITLMSDGSWSYNAFRECYGGTDPAAQHEELVREWNEAKAYAYEHGEVRSDFANWDVANDCLWALVDSEQNAQWWVARKDLIVSPADENAFGLAVQSDEQVVQVNIASLLTNNIQSDEQAAAEFKALYNFNDSYFSEAEANGRQVMVFLGTRVTNEVGFSDYARFAMSYYGDAYQYYYKGHPGTPTELYPSKQAELDELGITDVDSSVAAELILFFNPEIYLSGYASSTYASVPEGMAKGMFGMTKASGVADPQYADMDYWSSPAADAPEDVQALCDPAHTCYLVEFSDEISAEHGYSLAIWDATSSRITYYRIEGDAYVEVGEQQGVGQGQAVAEGEYVISSSLDMGKVLDVTGGSSDDGANVQLYGYNGTPAQRWRVSYDSEGNAVIANVGSGKLLDACAGMTANGTNVWQYGDNGSGAQRWKIVSNPDGTVRVVSSLSDTAVLDVALGSTADGTNVQLYAANGTAAQGWVFLPVTPRVSAEGQAELEDGCYTITSSIDLKKTLDVRDWSLDTNGSIQVWDATGWENQTFEITRLEDGFYRIESAWSGMSLAVSGGSIIPGAAVVQRPTVSGDLTQEWAIRELGGDYTLENVGTGLMLDLTAGEAVNGRGVQGYRANDTQAQRWLLAQTIDPATTIDEWAQENAGTIEDGTYVVRGQAGDDLVLDVYAAQPEDGTNVQAYEYNGTDAQRWVVTHNEKGYAILTNVATGKALDVATASKVPGTNVWQYGLNGTAAQSWVLMPQDDGSVCVVSALSPSVCLEVAGTTSGSNVEIGARTADASQRFVFERTRA